MKVNKNEFYIAGKDEENQSVYTTSLGKEVALSCLIESENKGALGRDLSADQIKKMFEALGAEAKENEIKVQVTGGGVDIKSLAYVEMLKGVLHEIECSGLELDVEMKVNGNIHPNFLFLEFE